MKNTMDIREHCEVLGSDGGHVGTVDHLDGNSIKLTTSDPAANGQHHYIPVSWVSSADDRCVRLTKSSQEAMRDWSTAAPAM
jgi:hypothetical protein